MLVLIYMIMSSVSVLRNIYLTGAIEHLVRKLVH